MHSQNTSATANVKSISKSIIIIVLLTKKSVGVKGLRSLDLRDISSQVFERQQYQIFSHVCIGWAYSKLRKASKICIFAYAKTGPG